MTVSTPARPEAAPGAPASGVKPLLEFDALSVGYGDEPIVRDFSASLPAGSITTIIGPNGAGKSTLLKAVYGLNRHFAGSIRLEGEPIERLAPRERLRRGIGLVPQGRCNFPLLTVSENLDLGAYTLRGPAVRQAIERVLEQFPLLAAKRHVLAGNLSGGEQQILETAMVLETSPKLLLLDEPSLGLSPLNQEQIFQMIADLRRQGLTVLVVEQNAHGALQVSDTGIVMELGRLFLAAPAAQVISDPRIRVAYLGGTPG
ncbi:ABC transporter ATP-binding protein [Ramlibacter rhizophilus]|uniref:ABC transporter ATP-binding protein n=1 Tax=Ramlibacter rhizophilus TaxID=1781167 RepID=A0A4Z0BK24_9BURK|nr:ABC transporter ATP-binding protein [Ramlibacter rhizophilus]TFY98607.1 ABC transporter ATP-binding protein [Ramlibacter rhizophilus]